LHRLDEGIAALERAVELNPNCSVAYGSLGTALAIAGRAEDAIANQEIAIRMNPRDPSIFFRFSGLALAHYTAGEFEMATLWAERAIHRMPRWYLAHFLLAASHVALGRSEQARAAVEAWPGSAADHRGIGCRADAAQGRDEDAGTSKSTVRCGLCSGPASLTFDHGAANGHFLRTASV
jgi:tetratricopeptide (TPR) repeat protein